jgi:hypothetical protein
VSKQKKTKVHPVDQIARQFHDLEELTRVLKQVVAEIEATCWNNIDWDDIVDMGIKADCCTNPTCRGSLLTCAAADLVERYEKQHGEIR